VDFIECLDEVGLLSCLSSIFVYISYLILELIYAVIFFYCGLPLAIEIFSSNIIGDHTGDKIFFFGVWSVFLLRFISFILSFLSHDCLTTYFHSESEFLNLLLSLVVF
jgi:hypothetical protein